MSEKTTTFHNCLLLICILCCSTATLNHSVYHQYNDDIRLNTGVDIDGFKVKPDLPLYLLLVFLLCGSYFPAVCGIALLCVRRSFRPCLKGCNVVASVVGFVCSTCLAGMDAVTIGEITHVECSYTTGYSCQCGTGENTMETSVLVCSMLAVRIVYLVSVCLSGVCTAICFILITLWTYRLPPKTSPVTERAPVRPNMRNRKVPMQNKPRPQAFTEYINNQHNIMMV